MKTRGVLFLRDVVQCRAGWCPADALVVYCDFSGNVSVRLMTIRASAMPAPILRAVYLCGNAELLQFRDAGDKHFHLSSSSRH